MRLAFETAKINPFYPFGAVIIGGADRAVLAQDVNNSKANPMLHGRWSLSTTMSRAMATKAGPTLSDTPPAPSPMCMGAIVWACVGGVVYGSSIAAPAGAGIDQIMLDASAVRDAAPFYRGGIKGGVLRAETDALFRDRRRV